MDKDIHTMKHAQACAIASFMIAAALAGAMIHYLAYRPLPRVDTSDARSVIARLAPLSCDKNTAFVVVSATSVQVSVGLCGTSSIAGIGASLQEAVLDLSSKSSQVYEATKGYKQ